MILDYILGYWVTDVPEVTEAFVAAAREGYVAIEQALEPITATINDLERDWAPRPAEFWQRAIGALASLRQAAKACLMLFEEEQSSKSAPVPLVLAATSLFYLSSLRGIDRKIEEAGILLTAYSAVSRPIIKEDHIRQRQSVLKALRSLQTETKGTIHAGRARLDKIPEEQQKLCDSKRTLPQPLTEVTDAAPVKRRRLRVVGGKGVRRSSRDQKGGGPRS